jgi:hypothetical protein
MSKGYKRTTKKYKILEQELIAKSNEKWCLDGGACCSQKE